MFEALWISFIIGFCLNMGYIALKAFQQLSVQHDKYGWIIPVSLSMAACEVFTTKLIVANSALIFIPLGIGGGLGCMGAMKMHKYLRNNSSDLLQSVQDWIRMKIIKNRGEDVE